MTCKYFSALSNEANLRDKGFAWLVFGVHDKTREILGTSYKNSMKSLQKLKQDLSQHTTDNNTFRDIYELKIEGKRVLMFQIPAAPRGIPMAWQGHVYARRGESLVKRYVDRRLMRTGRSRLQMVQQLRIWMRKPS